MGGLKRPRGPGKMGKKVYFGRWGCLGCEVRCLGKWKGFALPVWWKFERGVRTLYLDSGETDMPKAFESGSPAASGAPVGAEKGSMSKTLPTLMGWICDGAYDDGKPVGLTQLSLKRDGTLVIACLKIADQGGLKVEVRERSPDKALAALEAMLGADPCPWQTDNYPLGGKAKKRS